MSIELGDVYRLGNWPFADAVVTRIEDNLVTLARPFVYASEVSRYPLIGVEQMERITQAVVANWEKVDTKRVR